MLPVFQGGPPLHLPGSGFWREILSRLQLLHPVPVAGPAGAAPGKLWSVPFPPAGALEHRGAPVAEGEAG